MNNSSSDDEIVLKISSLFRLHKSGLMVRVGDQIPPVPPSLDPQTGVESKDITIQSSKVSELAVSGNTKSIDIPLRLFKPPNLKKISKVAILFYFHGGGFVIESTFSPKYHNYLNFLCYEANAMIVSVEYRRVPEHTLPAAYNDCWDALNWVASHAPHHHITNNSNNTTNTIYSQSAVREAWLEEELVDFSRVYLVGDSAGGNIAHQMALKIGLEGCSYWRRVNGMVLVHPMFWGEHRIGDEVEKCNLMTVPDLSDRIWALAHPTSTLGSDHPWHNPGNEPRLSSLGCDRVLVCVAEMDYLRDRGLYYKQVLEECGWQGSVEVFESKGENHVFHLLKPFTPNSLHLMQNIVAFIHPPVSNNSKL